MFDPGKTDRWSVRELQALQRAERERKLREVYMALGGIVLIIGLMVLLVAWKR